MKIYFASDHAGFELKEKLVQYVSSLGHDVDDIGPHEFNAEDDYPEFVTSCARAVASDAESLGIVIGKSGEGEAMCANRVLGVRAAVFYGGPLDIVELAREHNNANILSLGAHFISDDGAKEAVKLFLETRFSSAPRHTRRLAEF